MKTVFNVLISILLLATAFPAQAQIVPPSESVEEATPDDTAPAPQTVNIPSAVPTAPVSPPASEMTSPSLPASSPDKNSTGKEAAVTLTPAAPEATATSDETLYRTAVLQGINKVTAQAATIEAPIGEIERFGNLEIIAHNCWQSPPEERPENAALLEVWELKPGEGRTQIFNGWMFSSSPSLSSLSHPVYDITVLECQARAENKE